MPLSLSESEFSLAHVARGYREGTLSPVDVVNECLRRIEQFEPRVRAWVRVDAEGARAQARAAAEKFAGGRYRKLKKKPLAGIPVGIKDLIDVKGWPTLAGSRIREGHVAEEDAPVVQELRRAGAIILGKTVTTEFACFDPPPTKNPWNLAHTPGGSSSGSCAATALGMCLGAIGSQTGGSITRPASFCGVAGFKPAYGDVPLEGVVPLSYSMDHVGPIARRVRDLKILYRAVSSMPVVPMRRLEVPPRLRISESFLSQADEEMRQVFRAACEKFTAAGAEIESFELPASFTDVSRMHRRILCAETAHYHRETFAASADRYGPAIRQHIEEGLALSSQDLVEAQQHRLRFREELAHAILQDRSGWCCWLFPAAVGPAPGVETTGDPRFNSPWSYAGCPTVSFPCGLSKSGMPLGLQVVWGWAYTPSKLFSVARWCEDVLKFDGHPALLDEVSGGK